MLQKEFEELTGLQTTPGEYYEIEQIYNTLDTLDKQEFCERWKQADHKYLFNLLVKKVRDQEKWIRDNEKWAKEQQETKDACIPVLLDKADTYGDYKLKEVAISLVGVRTTAKISVEHDYKLCADEKNFILAMIAADEMTPGLDTPED